MKGSSGRLFRDRPRTMEVPRSTVVSDGPQKVVVNHLGDVATQLSTGDEVLDAQAEEVLPGTEVPSLDGDELLEDAAQIGRCNAAQAPVEREVEELVEDESPREARGRRAPGSLRLPCDPLRRGSLQLLLTGVLGGKQPDR
jgi:hypothetical protein